jgi:uncharacterized phiE125 gp8 family phage protein
MRLTKTVQPATFPVTLPEAKAHLRIDTDFEDSLISSLIGAATDMAEAYSTRQFVEATFIASMDKFPVTTDVIRLPRTPLISVTSIQYDSVPGVVETLSTDVYDVIRDDSTAMVVLKPGRFWPSVRVDQYNAVRITFKAGYTAVPDAVQNAIKMLVADMFEHREARMAMKVENNPTAMWLLDTVTQTKVV